MPHQTLTRTSVTSRAPLLPSRIHDGAWRAGDFEIDWRSRIATGFNPQIPDTSYGTISGTVGTNGFYPWRTTGAQIFIVSDDAADTGIGYSLSGIRPFSHSVHFDIFHSDVVLNGQNPVLIDEEDVQDVTSGSLADGFPAALGTVYVFAGTATAGVPDDIDLVLLKIDNEHNMDQSAIISCPAGRAIGINALAASSDGKQIAFRIAVRQPNEGGAYGAFIQNFDGATSNFQQIPLIRTQFAAGPGSQLELRAKGPPGMTEVGGFIEYRYLDVPSA